MDAVQDLKKPTYQDYVCRIPEKYRYKLDQRVDFENGDTDLHLVTIAEHLLNWEDVAPFLELSYINISDIKQEYPYKPALQRRAALLKWRNIFGYKATYGALLEVCMTKNSLNCAETIVQLLNTPGKNDQTTSSMQYQGRTHQAQITSLAGHQQLGQTQLSLAPSKPVVPPPIDGQHPWNSWSGSGQQNPLRDTVIFGKGKIDPHLAGKAFRSQYATLMLVIPDSLMLASRLYSEELASRTLLSKLVAYGLSSYEKNIMILNEVEDQIPSNPSIFSNFVNVLLSIEQLKEMGANLIASYRKELQSTSLTGSDILERYTSFLRAYYNTASVSPDYKWPRTPSTQYVNLAIVKKERVSRAEANEFTLATLHGDIDQIMKVKEPIEFEKVLENDSGKSVRYVLVEGAPGVGKSTFAWELCKQWDKIDVLKKFLLVLIVRLRDKQVQMATTLSDLFHHNDKDLQRAISDEVSRRDGQGILLILDGADELPLSIRTDPTSIFAQIIQGFCLPKATLLITSRPSAVTQLVGLNEPEKHVEILGFSEAQIHDYAASVFGSDIELYDFERYISSTPAIKGMLYVPLNTAIVIEVYRENKTKDRPIPNTLTNLYTDLCLLLLQRYLIGAQLIEDPSSLVELNDLRSGHSGLYQLFIDLAEIAFEGILEKQIVFQSFPEDVKGLGFTTASAELFTGRRVTHSFLHLTIQEYLAAYFIAQLSPDEQKEMFVEHSGKDHMDVVWRFFAGITGFSEIGWDVAKSSYSRKCTVDDSFIEISEGSKRVSLIMLRCLFEAQSERCMAALSSEKIIFSTVGSESFHPFDFFALGYCIANSSKCSWKVLLSDLNLQGDLMEMFTSGILTNLQQLSSHIHTLSFQLSPLGQDGVANLGELSPRILNEICVLRLSECGIDDPTLVCLAQLLSQMRKLENLSFSFFHKTGGDLPDICILLQSLSNCSNLQSLHFPQGFNWSSAGVQALEKLMQPTCTLESLSISCVKLSRQLIPDFLSILLTESSLHDLKIYGMPLASPRHHKILSLLEKNSNLQALKIDNCPLGNRGASVLATAMTKNHTITSLQVNGSHRIFEEGGKLLSQMLSENETLQYLKLSFDESKGIKDFSAARAVFPDMMESPPDKSRAVIWDRGAAIKLSYDNNN